MPRTRPATSSGYSPNSRLIKIPGVHNFRDLGGYPSRDGRRVRWGRLFRSGDLARLKKRGVRTLSNLGLETILDFRSAYETNRWPSRIPDGVRIVHLPVMDQANREMAQEIRERLKNKQFAGFDPDRLIMKAYQQFTVEFTPAYQTFIHTVLEAEGSPILWHCSAGKDRTGYAAAIVLRLLGVDLPVIIQDYLLSNQYVKRINKQLITAILARGYKAYQMISPLLRVQESWLLSAFESIDREWGSFDSYVSEGLALGPAEVERLRSLLLE